MGSYRKTIALLAALAASLSAQKDTASVTGKVTNSVGGAPVARAQVRLEAGPRRFGALTNADGKFSITGIEPGQYGVLVERVGFVKASRERVALRAGEETDPLNLELTPLGAIAGRVLDSEGEPVQAAIVSARSLAGAESATTDNKGRYRIGGLTPGKYRVKAWLDSFNIPPENRTDGSKEVHLVPTDFAARVTVAPGHETGGIDIPLRSSPFVKVSGKVLDIPASAKSVGIGITQWSGGDDSIGAFAMAKPDGSFVFWQLAPGVYTMSAGVMRNGRMAGPDGLRAAPIELEVGTNDIEHLELRMLSRFDLAGQVQFEDEHARTAFGDGAVRLSLWSTVAMGDSAQAQVASDGSFKLERIEAGRYRVDFEPSGNVYVKSQRLGSVQMEGGILDVHNGSGGGELTLMLSAEMGSITGTVNDSKGPVSHAIVFLIRDRSEVVAESTVGADGSFGFPRFAPGVYRLQAGDENVAGRLMNPSNLRLYDDQAVVVEVHAGETLRRDIREIEPND